MHKIAGFLSKIMLFSVILLCVKCSSKQSPKKINEGRIVYKIEYHAPENNVLVPLLPEKIEMKFKNSNTVININGFMGTFSLNYIAKPNNNKSYSLMRIFDKRYFIDGDSTTLAFGYSSMKNIKIVKTDDTVRIANLLCHKALAYCKEVSEKPFNIYYTYDINIKSPNANNPFKELDGVLLGFEVVLCGIDMKMTALEVVKEKNSDTIFSLPDGYRQISTAEMEDMIKQYNN